MKYLLSTIFILVTSLSISATEIPTYEKKDILDKTPPVDEIITVSSDKITSISTLEKKFTLGEIQRLSSGLVNSSSRVATFATAAAEATTTCYNITENYAVYDALANVGDQRCFLFTSVEKAKIEVVIINQPADTNYDLLFYKYEADTGGFTLIDYSNYTSGNEYTTSLVEADTYAFVITKISGTSTDNYIFGTFSYTGFDEYEANDRVDLGTPLRDNNSITANLDNAGDIDYYIYSFGVNQEGLSISMISGDSFQLELYHDDVWNVYPIDNDSITVTGAYGAKVYVRVIANPNSTYNPNATYKLYMSYQGNDFNDTTTSSPDGVTNLVSSSYVEAYDTITFSGTLVDIYDRPLANQKVEAYVLAGGETLKKETITSTLGRYGFYFDNMPICSGSSQTYEWSNYGYPRDYWDIEYTENDPSIIIRTSNDSAYSERVYVQICNERFVCTKDSADDDTCPIY